MSITFQSHEQHIISGNIGGDIEVRTTKGGTSVCNISIAVRKAWKDKNDEWQEETAWRKITVWGKDAENLEKFAQKGTNVTVICEDFDANAYENKEGDLKADVSFIARQIIINGNGKKKDDNEGGSSRGSSSRRSSGDSGSSRGSSGSNRRDDSGSGGRSSRSDSRPSKKDEFDDDVPF